MNTIENTDRARLVELLSETRSMSETTFNRAMTEAKVLALVGIRDAIEANFGQTLDFAEVTPLPVLTDYGRVGYVYTEDHVRTALRAHGIEAPGPILDTLVDMVDGELDAERGKVFPMSDDPRIDDSIVYNNTGDEPSTHLPVEHMPATDLDPSTDFDEVIGAGTPEAPESADPGDPETYEEGGEREADEEPVDEVESAEAPASDADPDLDDFKPVSGQAPKKPESGFEKIKKSKKKGSSK